MVRSSEGWSSRPTINNLKNRSQTLEIQLVRRNTGAVGLVTNNTAQQIDSYGRPMMRAARRYHGRTSHHHRLQCRIRCIRAQPQRANPRIDARRCPKFIHHRRRRLKEMPMGRQVKGWHARLHQSTKVTQNSPLPERDV